MEQFLGKDYVMVSDENFDDYLKFTGLSYIKRKAALTLKPIYRLTLNEDGTYTTTFKSKLANTDTKFKLGEEFEETKADGSKVRSTITIDGNKLIHVQIDADGTKSTHVREYYPDKMTVTTTAVGFDKTVTRQFKLVQ